MFFISKSSQRTSMAARTSMCTARAVASARKSRKASFVRNRIRLLERRIEIDIHAPSFIAVGEIEGHQELPCRSGDETGAITCVKTVPAEVAGFGGDLSRVDEETPVECAPDAISNRQSLPCRLLRGDSPPQIPGRHESPCAGRPGCCVRSIAKWHAYWHR